LLYSFSKVFASKGYLWPVFLFFLVGFLLLILLIKVALCEFSIEVAVLSNAEIGAQLACESGAYT
jgi:hypothetical protein